MSMTVNVKTIREAHGLSQKRLANMSGVSQAHISDIETGNKNPTIGILERIARALGVSVSVLIDEAPLPKEASPDA